jgi:hypothetical protein
MNLLEPLVGYLQAKSHKYLLKILTLQNKSLTRIKGSHAIHHLNGDTTDNRLVNLRLLCTVATFMFITQILGN